MIGRAMGTVAVLTLGRRNLCSPMPPLYPTKLCCSLLKSLSPSSVSATTGTWALRRPKARLVASVAVSSVTIQAHFRRRFVWRVDV